MIIVIVNGTSQVGKDKFVSYVKEVSDFRVKNLSSVDKVKSVAELCFGWDGKKEERSRKFLSDLKRIWSEYNDGPFNDIIDKIKVDTDYCVKNNKDTRINVYFVHIREPQEIDKLKKFYGNLCLTLLVKKEVEFIPNNDSDMNVENYEYDIIIDNNSDEKDLKKKSRNFSKKLKKLLKKN